MSSLIILTINNSYAVILIYRRARARRSPMENFSQYTAAYIRRVEEQLVAARAQVAALEANLARAKKAIEALGDDVAADETPLEIAKPARETTNSYARMSIKALAMEALQTHFRAGATAVELLDYFSEAYGRNDVPRTSLSPQLTILKNEGKISREGLVWRLVENG